MRTIDGFEELHRWVINADNTLHQNPQTVFYMTQVNGITSLIDKVSLQIAEEYSFYSDELPKIARILFLRVSDMCCVCNIAALGELYIIIKHLHDEPSNASYWSMIHPRIAKASKGLYLDTHYASAASRALVEVETKLRELFKALKPGAVEPNRVGDLIGALLTENGAYHFCDTSTPSGRDYRRGIQLLFEGAFAAYRNPSSHLNSDISKENSFAQIALASQLMDVLEPRS